jgi:hypothetical protein
MVELDLNTIYLKNTNDSSRNGGATIVHEAAHLLHGELDTIISKLWIDLFPLKREVGWCPEKIMLENGLVSSYASFNILTDSHNFTRFIEDENPVSESFSSSGVEIIIQGEQRNYASMVDGVLVQFSNLPTTYLMDVTKKIVVTPSLNCLGAVSCGDCTDNYLRIAEDVAESTQTFYQAATSNNLSAIRRVYDILHGVSKSVGFASDKLKFLGEYGFIGNEEVENLFDSDFLKTRIADCEINNFNKHFLNRMKFPSELVIR